MVDPKRPPDGGVAQRFRFPDGEERWVLMYMSKSAGLSVRMVSDEEAAEWPQLIEAGNSD